MPSLLYALSCARFSESAKMHGCFYGPPERLSAAVSRPPAFAGRRKNVALGGAGRERVQRKPTLR